MLDAIRGKDVETAIGILSYNPRYASSIILKLLQSAIANAENNNDMNPEENEPYHDNSQRALIVYLVYERRLKWDRKLILMV